MTSVCVIDLVSIFYFSSKSVLTDYDSITNIFTKEHAFLLPDFSYDGTRLIASSDDDSIVVYDCEKVSSCQCIHIHTYDAVLRIQDVYPGS